MASSVIVSFPSTAERQAFLEKASADWPELLQHSYLPRRRPDAVFESLTESDVKRLREFVGERGRIFEDVKFDTFTPAERSKSGR